MRAKTTSSMFAIFALTLSLFLIVFFTLPLAVHAEEADVLLNNDLQDMATTTVATDEVVPDSAFKVVDEFRDEADLGNGIKKMRIYSESRQIFVDKGEKKVRPVGWNKFNEDSTSKIRTPKIFGYNFSVPFTGNKKIDIASGNLEIKNPDAPVKIFSPSKALFRQYQNEDQHTVSEFKDVFKNIDINFIDKVRSRTKQIIINKKPDNINEDSETIFWESYKVPRGSTVLVGDTKYTNVTRTYSPTTVVLKNKEALLIDASIIYDSKVKDDSYCDMSQVPVEQIVSYDEKNLTLKIGLVVKGNYLLDKDRVYPVIVDPSYLTCTGTSCVTDFYLKWLIDKSTLTDSYLFMGYDYASGVVPCSPAGDASRHPVFKFDVSSIPAGSTITDSSLKLKYTGIGCGEYNSYISLQPKKITSSWAYSSATYSSIRSSLTSGGSPLSLSYGNLGSDCPSGICTWNLDDSMVQTWVNNSAQNYGFLIEPQDNFSSGSKVPSSWSSKQRLFKFYSSDYNSANSPYLDVTYTIAQPDLVIYQMGLTTDYLIPGQTITADVKIKNAGTANANVSKVGYYYSDNSVYSGSDVFLNDNTVQSLAPGVISSQVSNTIIIPANATPGTRYICYVADYTGVVPESIESNNYLCTPVTIGSAKPDLFVSGFSYSKDVFEPGETVTFSKIEVKNKGTASAGSFKVGIYLSNDKTFSSASDVYLTDYTISSLAAGATHTKNLVTMIIPSNTSAGTKYILMVADYNNQISESDETDNTNYQTILVVIDLLEPNNSSAQAYNIGTLTSFINLNLYLTVNDYDWFKFTYNSKPYYFRVRGINSSVTGQYGIQFSRSGSTALIETVSVNNSSIDTFLELYDTDAVKLLKSDDDGGTDLFSKLIYDLDQSTYDFLPLNFSITNTGVHYSGNSDTVTVSGQIKNNGNANASGISYQLNLSNGAQEYALSGLSPSSLSVNSGETKSVTLTGTIPGGMPYYDTYQVEVILDSDSSFTEISETNNTTLTFNTVPVQQWSSGGGGGGPAPVDSIPAVASIPIGLKPNGAILVADLLNHRKNFSSWPDKKSGNSTADPVNSRNGAFEFEQNDFVLTGRGFPIKISRTYNSKAAERNERFGAGWTSSNHMYYFQDPTTKEVQIYLGGSLVSYFTTPDNGATYVAEKGNFNTLYNEGNYLVYKTIDGIRYKFALKLIDNIGMIDSVVDTNNNTTQLAYVLKNGVKLLSTITDPSGRAVEFVYPASDTGADWDKVKEIRESLSGISRLVSSYTYDASNNLIQVHRENFYQSEPIVSLDSYYSYDSSSLLLNYTDTKGTVLYNEYDSSGRVIKQYEKNPNLGSDDKRLIYEISYQDSADPAASESAHCTATKNYRDASNYYSEKVCFNADELKIYSERGDNIERWSYDASGMVSAYIDGNNNVSNYEHDAKRRVTKETLPDTSWRTVNIFEYENAFNRLIKKTETVSTVAAPTVPVEIKTGNFMYDGSGNLIVATDALGNEEKWEYNANGTIKKRINELEQAINYTYDATGNYVVQESAIVTQADNTTQTIAKNYNYDVYGRRTGYTDPRDLIYTYAYDYRGNLRQATNPDGNSKYFTYDSEDHRISETDELGRVTNYTFDADINASLLKIEKLGAGGPIVYEKQYDWVGNPKAEIDPMGGVISYVYDSANRIYSKTDAIKTASYEYYGNGKLKKETNTGGARSDYFYDARGNNIQVNRYYDGVNYIANKFEYDGFNRKTKTIDGKNYETAYSYDLMDRVSQVDDALNNHAKYFYDANGNKTGEITPLAFVDASLKNSFGHSNTDAYDGANRVIKKINADDKYTLYFYDANGNLISQIDRQNSDGTQNNHATNFQYDALNRQIKVTDALGGMASSTYDAVGNVIGKKDQMNRVWNYTYDAFNRLTDEYDPANNNTHYTYDKAGNKLTVTDSQSKTTQFQYDALNRLVKVTDTLGNYEEYGYDLLDNKTSVKDKNGNITAYVYDKLSRLTGETNPQSTVISYTYDANNNRLTENIAGKITSYEYDELNRLKKRTEPGNKIFTFSYDGNSNKTGEVNANSDSISYTYDKLDRLTKKILIEGEVSYSYDQWNNLTSASDLSGTANYTYDLLNRNTGEAKTITGLAGGFNITREYFADSAQKSITDAASKKVNYSYNNRGLLDSVVYSGNNLAVYTYTSFGKPLTITYGNGVITTYTYDELQRPKNIETKLGTNVLFKQEYSYDKDSNRTQMVEYKLTDGQLTSSTISYAYDSLNQISSADYKHLPTGQDLSYTYDVWGNRTGYHTAFGNTVYNYTADTNEIAGLSLNSRLNIAYATDSNGNITKESYSLLGKNTKTVNYDWNSENKLNSITYQTPNQTDNVLAFAYDDFGNRVKKFVNGQNTYYINNGLTVLNELDAAGNVVKTMVNGLGPVAEIDKDNNIQYLNQDILGSTALITDSAGAIMHQYGYDPFGNISSELGETDKSTNYLYTGQEFDAESEFYYYNARYYNPVLGRFLSKDPIIHRADGVLGFNEYIYVKNNPLKYTDPSGKFLDIILDAAFVAIDVGQTVFGAGQYVYGWATDDNNLMNKGTDNLIEGGASLTLDAAAAFVPFVTGAGAAYRASKVMAKTDKAIEGYKGIEKAVELGKTAEKLEDISQSGKRAIEINGNIRYPDKLTSDIIQEVKGGTKIGERDAKQISDFVDYAKMNDKQVILSGRSELDVSKIDNLIQSGDVVKMDLGYMRGYETGKSIKDTLIIGNPVRYYNWYENLNSNMCSFDDK